MAPDARRRGQIAVAGAGMTGVDPKPEGFSLEDRFALGSARESFEQSLCAGGEPRIDECLEQVSEPLREALRLMLEESLRELLGRELDPGSVLARRYTVIKKLGRGGFGSVYLARDEQLQREVALKVPHRDLIGEGEFREQDVEAIVQEARKIATLNHPGIITLHDVALHEGLPFLVLEYVEGPTLEEEFRSGRIDPGRLARLVQEVAEAIHHAHLARIVHRDLKPSNLLLGTRGGRAKITDFGLALRYDPLRGPRGEVAGTYAYMAPEQVRGEAWIDGRADIWALGIILYRGLTGEAPFPGRDRDAIFDAINHRDPTPPKQVNDEVHPELARICTRCLAKLMGDRYPTAAELAIDLRLWHESTPIPIGPGSRPAEAYSTPTPARDAPLGAALAVAPKGLASFDSADADDFLALIPGPRGRDGLPESLRFWKSWVERPDDREGPAQGERRVGLLYGPSGAGKSSFLGAGLLPRLDRRVRVARIEATAKDTESRMLSALRDLVPALPSDIPLPDAVAEVRATTGSATVPGKVLIVLDQFEQWLQAHPGDDSAPLILALRQCDGRRVQALVLLRDDFWMAATRLFRALDIPLRERVNSLPVEPLDAPHVRKVLEMYGRACHRLTGPGGSPSPTEAAFLEGAARTLAGREGSVLPVRLSLFTEVVRRRPWTTETLIDLGGPDGIGVRFLADLFDRPTSPPAYIAIRKPACAILGALLPPASSDLRGPAISEADLAISAGYSERPREFAEVLAILRNDLRLISPADMTATGPPPNGDKQVGASYRLAHDFLVAPVRLWLERDLRATRRGRARLLLARLASDYGERPDRKHLPSLIESGGILLFARDGTWTHDERRMMRRAMAHHAGIALVGATTCAAALVFASSILDRLRASERLRSVWTSRLDVLPEAFSGLDVYRDQLVEPLRSVEMAEGNGPSKRAIASALLFRYEPDSARADALRDRLLAADVDEVTLHREALATHPDRAGIGPLWTVAADTRAEPARRLRAAAALALLDPDEPRWSKVAPAVVTTLKGEDRATIRRWGSLLGSARAIVPALAEASRPSNGDEAVRVAAAEALIEIHERIGRNPQALAQVVPDVPVEAFRPTVRAILHLDGAALAIESLNASMAKTGPPPASYEAREESARREAQAVLAQVALGQPSRLWPRLGAGADPLVRANLIDLSARLGLPATILLDRTSATDDADELMALLMALAEMAGEPRYWAESDHVAVLDMARRLHSSHGDPGVHGASDLLLRRLSPSEAGRAIRDRTPPPPGARWTLGPNGHVFALTGPLQGVVGTPEEEPGRDSAESRHHVRCGRSLEFGTTEVTVGQFRAFLAEEPGRAPASVTSNDVEADVAVSGVDWYESARYCNWLSRRAKLTPAYPEPVGPGMVLEATVLDGLGYRLPTEAEWELACRVGTITSRPFAATEARLSQYSWTFLNSRDQVKPVALLLPNRLGLFDMLGNQFEWCHDGQSDPDRSELPPYPAGTPERPASDRPPTVTVVGVDVEPHGASTYRSTRGGAYDFAPLWSRSGARYYNYVFRREPYNGFRVVRTVP